MMADLAVGDLDTVDVVSAKKRSPMTKFEVSRGWVARGFTFEVAWSDNPEFASKVRSEFGGRRFGCNGDGVNVPTVRLHSSGRHTAVVAVG